MHAFYRSDQVGPGTLGNFQRQGRLPIDAGEPLRVLEGGIDPGDIGKGHHLVAIHLDRHVEYVLQGLDDAGNLDRIASAARIQTPRRHQLIVAADQIEQRSEVDAVAVEHLRVDDDLQQLLAFATDIDLKHFRHPFEGISQATSDG